MRAGGRSPILALALVLTTGVLGVAAGPSMVFAESPGPNPFAMPTSADLAAAGSAAVVDTPAVVGDTIDLTEVTRTAFGYVDALAPEAWEVDALAASLGPDPVAAFELVRDSIGFDPYAGVLRGAEGTLAARTGNAFDRALLLKGLLDAQGATTQFAFGQLPTDVAAKFVDHAFDKPAKPLAPADFSPLGPGFERAAAARARRDYALLSTSLGDRLTGLTADATSAAVTDVTSHVWVQVSQPDGTWLDLDPSMPDAQPGQTLTSTDEVAATMPDADRQTVTVRVVAETLQDGGLTETTVLEALLDPVVAADQQLLLTFAPADGAGGGGLLGGGGGGLLGGGAGGAAVSVVPVLSNGISSQFGDAFTVSGIADTGGGLMGGGDGSQVDLASLAVEIETDGPGMNPLVARHVIADRVPAEARASGVVTPDGLLPLTDASGDMPALASVAHVMLSTGGSSPRAYAYEQGTAAQVATEYASGRGIDRLSTAATFWPTAIADQSLVVASEQRLIPAVNDADVRSFVARPRVYVVSTTPVADDPSQITTVTDLLIDGLRTLPSATAAPDSAARHQLWYGVLQGAMETEFGLGLATAYDPDNLEVSGVSLDMAQPLTVITADEPGSVDGSANAGLRAALEAGYVLAVPGDPNGATTWWQIGPDGGTRAVLAPSLGGLRMKIGPKVPPPQPPSPGGNNPNPNPGGNPGGKPGGKPGGSRPFQVKDGFDRPTQRPPARTTQPPKAAACSGDEETMVETCPGPPTIGFVSAHAAVIGGVIIAAAVVIYVIWG